MEELKIPTHVAIILDGNRRWAKKHLLPKLEGHRRGFSNIKKMADYILKKELNIYQFIVFQQKILNGKLVKLII